MQKKYGEPRWAISRMDMLGIFLGMVFLSYGLLLASPQESPALLQLEAPVTPQLGEPLTLYVSVVSQVKASARFQIQLSLPVGINKSTTEILSGEVAGRQRKTFPVVLTPEQWGDFRVSARLQFQPEGASAVFQAERAAVVRLRATKERSQIFLDEKQGNHQQLSDRIKQAKPWLRRLAQDERDRQINRLQGLSENPSSSQYRVPAPRQDRQQNYLRAAQRARFETSDISPSILADLKQALVGPDKMVWLGSQERYPDVDGLVRRRVPVSYVYRKELELKGGQAYSFETRNLSTGSDTVAYLFAQDELNGELVQVARDDDGGETPLGSYFEYTPKHEGSYKLMVRSYDYESRGACDVFINGEFIERTDFAGVVFKVTADAGDQLHTVALQRSPNRTDTVLMVLPDAGRPALWDDDGGMELGSKVVLPELRAAEVIVGAYSSATEGQCDLILNTADGSYGPHPRGDLDGDGLSNELERVLGTDPTSDDTDRDGFLDGWEALGVRDTDFPGMGASPNAPDIFVQIDWMQSTHNHQPREESILSIIDSFANEGITLHVDRGNEDEGGQGHLLPPPWTHIDSLSLGSLTFRDIRAANLDPSRDGLYHYCIFAHKQPGNCSSGVAQINGWNFLVTLGCFFGQIGTSADQAGTFMHELGHNLGLQHGGFQSLNDKPNYRSVMNYLFQIAGTCGTLRYTTGVVFAPCSTREFYYSHGLSADLDENCLDESVGIGEGPLDWNGDGSIDDCVRADINHRAGSRGDGRFDLLRDYDDYANLRIAGLSMDGPFEEEIVSCAPPLP
ncbi:MAG: hypothetical protein HYR55_02825 [Acidobacteria bacterium]|nr:hypothetical protein [Acidobacteriota bacterium]MBI3655941.1 hypothetical protein [Acidobacteriota bacterium]